MSKSCFEDYVCLFVFFSLILRFEVLTHIIMYSKMIVLQCVADFVYSDTISLSRAYCKFYCYSY